MLHSYNLQSKAVVSDVFICNIYEEGFYLKYENKSKQELYEIHLDYCPHSKVAKSIEFKFKKDEQYLYCQYDNTLSSEKIDISAQKIAPKTFHETFPKLVKFTENLFRTLKSKNYSCQDLVKQIDNGFFTSLYEKYSKHLADIAKLYNSDHVLFTNYSKEEHLKTRLKGMIAHKINDFHIEIKAPIGNYNPSLKTKS